ncbi:MAG: protein-disulfide reductase DsbD family protein [Vicinamibacterales bacterium]
MRVALNQWRTAAAIVAALAAGAGPAQAQAPSRPKATIAIVTDRDGAHGGESIKLAIQLALPDGVHVQSNTPRDQFLIPTAVTVTPPSGITVDDVVYPAAVDFTQAGQPTALSVFEQRFAIGVRLGLAASLAPGDITVPVRIRYQACDERTCFAPLREESDRGDPHPAGERQVRRTACRCLRRAPFHPVMSTPDAAIMNHTSAHVCCCCRSNPGRCRDVWAETYRA